MKKRPLKRSGEYKARIRSYALDLARRYRPEIADVFLDRVAEIEALLAVNNHIGTDAPYLLAGQRVALKELYFESGPARYCLIYEITEEYVGLVSFWHGAGSRTTGTMKRLWMS